MSIVANIKATTTCLDCVGDTGAIAVNAIGFLEDSSFLFNGIILPRYPENINSSLRVLFNLVTGRGISKSDNLERDISMIYKLNNNIGVLGRELTYVKQPFRSGVAYNVCLADSSTRIGSIYVDVKTSISPLIGYAGSIKGFKTNKVANDDSILILSVSYCYRSRVNRVVLGVVADGVSSLGKGYYASSESIKTFTEGLIKYIYLEGDLTPDAIYRIYKGTAEYVLKLNLANNSSTATTFTAIIYPVLGKSLFVHVGDTRIYYFSNSELRKLTEDDKLQGTNTLTKAIGVRVDEPTMGVIDFNIEDVFILLSDGVYNVINEKEMREILIETRNPYKVVKKVLFLCEKRKTRDDASIGVIKRLM